MSLTPLLGELATYVADAIETSEAAASADGSTPSPIEYTDAQVPMAPIVAENAVVVCGYG